MTLFPNNIIYIPTNNMLAIKLKPIGKKHQKSFRFVVQERRSKLVGKFIDDLGWYNPHTNKSEINKEKAAHWMKVGAKPTMTVAQIFKKAKMSLPAGLKTSKTYAVKKAEVKAEAAPEAKAPVAEAPKA